jgi:hypothetical protein
MIDKTEARNSTSLSSSKAPSCRFANGDVMIIRYFDHILFRDSADLSLMKPIVREAIGWLDSEGSDFIRLVWERYAEPVIDEQSKTRVTGLVIRRCDVVEAIKIG